MRASSFIVFAAILLAAPCVRAEEAAQSLQGYGPFHFGMSAAEARAADSSLTTRADGGPGLDLLQSTTPVMFGDFGFESHLNFRNGRLNRIVFEAAGQVRSLAQCASIFDAVMAAVEQNYGVLSGPPGPSEYGTALPVRTTPRGSTLRAYQYGDEQMIHANRRAGVGWIEAIAHSGPYPGAPAGVIVCDMTIDLRERGPSPITSLDPPTREQLAAARPLDPVWSEQPDSDAFEMTMPQYYPRGRVEVNVQMDCLVIDDGRLNCVVADERPVGGLFGQAALRLSRAFRMARTVDGQPTLGRRVRVPVTLTLTGPGEAPPQGASNSATPEEVAALRALAAAAPSRAALDAAPLIARAEWIARPDAQAFAHYYPEDALRRGVSGRIVLECLIGGDGRLQCAVAEEEPADAGFGLAALGIARDFRMAAQVDGQPSAGKRVRVPIRFNVQ